MVGSVLEEKLALLQGMALYTSDGILKRRLAKRPAVGEVDRIARVDGEAVGTLRRQQHPNKHQTVGCSKREQPTLNGSSPYSSTMLVTLSSPSL